MTLLLLIPQTGRIDEIVELGEQGQYGEPDIWWAQFSLGAVRAPTFAQR